MSVSHCRSFKNVELVVSKCYYASGIIAITIIYQVIITIFVVVILLCAHQFLLPFFSHEPLVPVSQFTVYVSLLDNNGESPLLDSRFPDVSGKGRGYQLSAYTEGEREDWPSLRKVSIWQTVNALEQVRRVAFIVVDIFNRLFYKLFVNPFIHFLLKYFRRSSERRQMRWLSPSPPRPPPLRAARRRAPPPPL